MYVRACAHVVCSRIHPHSSHPLRLRTRTECACASKSECANHTSTNVLLSSPIRPKTNSIHRHSSVDLEDVQVFLRSLNESVPAEMLQEGADDGNRRITQLELRNCIKDMYHTLGYEYSDRLGDLLVYEALQEFDVNHDGYISRSELRMMLAEYKKR